MKLCYLTIFLLLLLTGPAAALDTTLGKQLLAEINLARTAPRTYARYLRDFRGRFRGKFYLLPGNTVRVRTVEGKAAVDEAITYLSRQKSLGRLSWSDGLSLAAAELAEEQGRAGGTGHVGRQSGGVKERIERHGEWDRQIAENIGYGPRSAREMVMQLIIDDGVKGRGHRKNIFTKGFTVAGVACGPHPRYGSMCVIDFAGGFREEGTPDSPQ
jgi:uncharacterized protein YkwD